MSRDNLSSITHHLKYARQPSAQTRAEIWNDRPTVTGTKYIAALLSVVIHQDRMSYALSSFDIFPKKRSFFISTDMICGGLICRTIWSEIWAFSQLWGHHMLWVDGRLDLLGDYFHLLQVHSLLSSARHPPFPSSRFLPQSAPSWRWHPLAGVGGQHQCQNLEWSPTTK